MVYVVLSFALLSISGFASLFPHYYISELVLSFLPYGVLLFSVGLVISLIFVRKHLRARRGLYKNPKQYWGFGGLFTIFFGILFLSRSSQFTRFYHNTGQEQSSTTGSLSVLFANIHKDNTDYTGIENMIRENNPDLLLFVEFADHHYQHLKEFLQTNYPYSNSTTRSKQFVGSMVFSKYKIENRADDFPQGMWRYGYFSVSFAGQPYYFYLVHTSSPDSYQHFVMRNDQLTTFAKDFTLHEKSRKNDNVIVAGDFNITPWSSYYATLQILFSGKLANVTQQLPILFTWRLFDFPLLRAQIDHVWASSGVIVDSFQSIPVVGSDHRGLLMKLGVQK